MLDWRSSLLTAVTAYRPLAQLSPNHSHVLVTRPNPEGDELASRLASAGLDAVTLPAHGFEADPPKHWPDWKGTAHRLAVFVSPRAVRFGLKALPEGYLDGARVAALGPATASALEANGLVVDLQPQEEATSEGLLQSTGLSDRHGTAVILCAPGGRQALQLGLEQRGWTVHVQPVYRRHPLPLDPERVAALTGARSILSVWTSGLAMDHILGELPPATARRVCEGTFLVISRRLAARARALGAARIELADGPGNDALLSAITRLSIPSTTCAGTSP